MGNSPKFSNCQCPNLSNENILDHACLSGFCEYQKEKYQKDEMEQGVQTFSNGVAVPSLHPSLWGSSPLSPSLCPQSLSS